ncbi:MAG: hypothetical protein CM1200mP10_27100 [Candidatus Neomarinimicrobiota bacterium]|nr:MAG: hypothetical protein CM1200mP10_27100 [Candidatus Neomarinimicrobiota bacterium]
MGRDRSSEITGAISYRSIPHNLVEIAVQFDGENDEYLIMKIKSFSTAPDQWN